MIFGLTVLLALVQGASSPSASQAPAPPPPVSPPPTAVPADPATLVFPAGASGLVLVAIKADRTADYEAVIEALQAALAGRGPTGQRIGAGWIVYKAQETDAKGNAIYVHLVAAPEVDLDYRPSVVIEGLANAIPEELLVKYRDAFAAPPTRLSLGIFADLAVSPRMPQR